jgi:signal transduction histidine kinase
MTEGLTSNIIPTITEDHAGRIYVGTTRSVDRLNPVTGRVRQYTVADGLAANESISAYCDRCGRLWFGTTNGLSLLVPEKDPEQTDAPPILIGGLSVSGVAEQLSELGETRISDLLFDHTRNQVQVDFFGLGFATGEVLRYQFMLEGADRDWGPPLDQRSVNYANLKPGSYRFLVRAVNADGVVSAEPAFVAFTITPPMWQRWWFITIVAVALAAAIHLIYRYHTRRLIELERVRTRIATDLHDDIGASLSKIAILSEVASQELAPQQRHVAESLAQVAGTSRETVDAMSDIVWAVNPQRDHLSDLLHRMRRFAEDLLDAREIEFTFHANDHGRDARLSADLRREVYLIFKECVNNLVKHSGCTKADLEFRVDGHWLVVKVNDNGRGFDTTQVHADGRSAGLGGHGLGSMHRRARALRGSFVIDSERGRGTSVTLRIPTNHRQRWLQRSPRYPNGR